LPLHSESYKSPQTQFHFDFPEKTNQRPLFTKNTMKFMKNFIV
jgi:hypothetical protein